VAEPDPNVSVALRSGQVEKSGRPRAEVIPVKSGPLAGVTFGKHQLEVEGERLQLITAMVGRRIKKWLGANPDGFLDERFVDIFRYYQAGVLNQLREQRERAIAAGASTMSTEQLEAQFQVEVLRAIESFTAADWEIADRARCKRFGAGRWVPATEER